MLQFRYAKAEELEKYLGDPANPKTIFSFHNVVQLDEADEYPEAICKILSDWNFHHFFVPTQFGGKFTSFEELNSLIRVVARRDITAAWAHSVNTYLAAVNVWLMGSHAQKHELGKMILSGAQVSAAYHEKEHGSDLLSCEVEAIQMDDGFRLQGTKWVIGNAMRSKLMTVFARTSTLGKERDYSLFLVKKDELPPDSYSYLTKVKTLGLRGADISGIQFKNAPLSQNALIGRQGSALENTIKSFQITRTLVTGLSLGALDTALRIVLEFALSRKLYGRSITDLPQVASQLIDAFLDLLICDCLALVGVRGLHIVPEQMSVWSAIIKYLVPITVDNAIQSLAVVFGARYYIREGHFSGIFQKIWRDHLAMSFGHTPTFLNLSIISQNLSQILKKQNQEDHTCEHNLQQVFSLAKPLPAFDASRLTLFSRGREDVTQGIKSSINLFSSKMKDEQLVSLSQILLEELVILENDFLNLSQSLGRLFHQSPEAFKLTKRFCILFAAAACLHLWVYNQEQINDFFSDDRWLILCLERLIGQLHFLKLRNTKSYRSQLFTEVIKRFKN